LLVALLVMGVLMAISLAVSTLVLRESQVTRALIDSGQSYYAAESGVELALYGINHELPGWQPTNDEGYAVAEISDFAVAEYRVNNRCKAFPCFDTDFEIDVDNPPPAQAFYYELGLNETISIPLFITQAGGERQDVGNFTVEFWSPLNPGVHLDLASSDGVALSSWDVLRWKVLGIEEGTGEPESISDFTALSTTGTGQTTDAQSPSWFGTVDCDNFNETGNRYLDTIECISYGGSAVKEFVAGQVAEVVTGLCGNDQAREYYNYRSTGADRKIDVEDINPCYSIHTFLSEHYLNYLTLTNFMNPAVLRDDVSDKDALSKLYVRVELFPSDMRAGNETVRAFSHIKSFGYSGDSKKVVDVRLQKGSFMPVFNFSLYSTYKKDDSDYYGGVDNDEVEE